LRAQARRLRYFTGRSKVVGVRLLDQGVDKKGNPADGFTPGMDIHAALTVVGDGPVGPSVASLMKFLACRKTITFVTGRWA